MPTLLLATDIPFWEESIGVQARICAVVRHVQALGISLHVYLLRVVSEAERDLIGDRFPGITLHARDREPGEPREPLASRSIQERIRAWLGRRSPSAPDGKDIRAFESRRDQAHFHALCATLRPTHAMVVNIRLSYLIRNLPNRRRTITLIDTIDVMHQRMERFLANGLPHWVHITREEEAAILRRFDYVIAIQPREAELLRTMVPPRRVLVAMHPSRLHWQPPQDELPVRLFFMASNSQAGRHALDWFLTRVWPMVIERSGDSVRLGIAGRIADAFQDSPPPRADLLGFQPDITAAYASHHIAINPVQFGGGLKIKCVEALCHGRPLVTTPIGAEGMEDGAGIAFRVAADATAFAEELLALIGDPERRQALARSAFAYARTHFTQEAAFAELTQILRGR